MAALLPFLPHAIVQLQTCFIGDLELIVRRIPHASSLVVEGKQVMAQGRDGLKGKENRGRMIDIKPMLKE